MDKDAVQINSEAAQISCRVREFVSVHMSAFVLVLSLQHYSKAGHLF